MNKSPQSFSGMVLSPFEYHKKLRDHFKSRKKTWNWFSEESNKSKQVEEFKTNLLKNTYRMDNESHENLYELAHEVCQALKIDAQVTLYQEHNSLQLNAGISIIDNEAHIVFSGNLVGLLSEDEIKALLAHELSHYLFYKIDNGEYEITRRIALALANDVRSEDAIIETARIFQLYMELFCDNGALQVCHDYKTVIQMLVKLNTGLTQVNAESYLAQAQEIINFDSNVTLNESHPESYIRCLALHLHVEKNEDYFGKVKHLIEGEIDLNKLDIFQQSIMQEYTKDLLQLVVTPVWMNSSAVTNLCKEYFSDFYRNAEHKQANRLAGELEKTMPSVKNYMAYLLLDFAKADPDMESAPMGHTLEIAELLGLKDHYEKNIRKELKLTARDFKIMKEKALAELQEVKEGKEESLYND
ncbi:MAG: M48 family metalloprotease [Deltaproteobacteria bacterium]|nr:M48 family metalloprotease [Deltaproteobacteria bacterium]